MENNSEANVVGPDTVHGARAKESIMMTMLLRNTSLMLIFLLPDCTQASVKAVFNQLTDKLGMEEFRKCFPVILTDNGSEFKKTKFLERTDNRQERTRIFYCDPLASWQKTKLERILNLSAGFLPKFSHYKDMTLLANHINCTARSNLYNRTPFELAELLNSEKLLKVPRLKKIQHDKVVLAPQLFRQR